MSRGKKRWGWAALVAGFVCGVLLAAAAPAVGGSDDAEGVRLDAKMLRAVGKLEPKARSRWPSTFAGTWLDGSGTVFIAFTEDAKENARRLRGNLPRSRRGDVKAVARKRSLRELELRQNQMIAEREAARRGELAFPSVPGPEYDLDIDVPQNILVVTVEDDTEQAVEAFERRYGEDVVVEQGPLFEPDVCTRYDCAPDLRAGLATYTPAGGRCSTAFNVIRRGIGKGYGILSAGHCSGGIGSSRRHRLNGKLQSYGQVVGEAVGGQLDVELHSVKKPFKSNNACIFVPIKLLQQCGEVRNVAKELDALPIGLRVCKSGSTTGHTCGEVLGKNAAPAKYVAGAKQFVKTSYCAKGGDSGGAVFSYSGRTYNAYGIHSGSKGTCGSDDQASVFGHLEFVRPKFPVAIYEK